MRRWMLMCGWVALPLLASGQTIGIQFTGDQYTKHGESLLKDDDIAGLANAESRFWNGFNVDSDGNALLDHQLADAAPLVADLNGQKQATQAAIFTSGFTDVLLTGSNNKTANEKLYKHALAVRSRGEAGVIKISRLKESGFGTYDIVVFVSREYFGGDPTTLATLTLNGRAPIPVKVPHFATERQIEFADASVTREGYDAKKLGAFVKFTGLSGDLNLTLDSALGGTVGIAGLQIIKTSSEASPQPPAVPPLPRGRLAMPGEILVITPAYTSDIKGTTPIVVDAPAYKLVRAFCWKQGEGFGRQSLVAQVMVDDSGKARFDFPADEYPNGPITIRISGQRGEEKDDCYLQLYNTGGVSWNQGIPKTAPPAAKNLKLIFEDDFTGPLSIGAEPDKRYYDHLPPRGEHDFGAHPFRSFDSPANPFLQRDSYLRIRVSDKTKSGGLISSVKPDFSGVKAKPPAYFECRFIGPKANGSWPAFWLLSVPDNDKIVDELDIIEAYGGDGPGQPNAGDSFRISPHAWNQGEVQKQVEAEAHLGVNNPIRMSRFGIPSAWYESPHTYGCFVGEMDTIYYVDDIEVARHPTYPVSKREPAYFLIDLATAGGWPVDLSRYDGVIDMYVDYVRVYAGGKQ